MKEEATVQQFITLRAQGVTFARIGEQLGVSKSTLIEWSRRHQHLIQNLRTIEWETCVDAVLASRQERLRALAGRLERLEKELAGRDLASVPTSRLHGMAESLRRSLNREINLPAFSAAVEAVPAEELSEEVLEWKP